ncbi:glycosidase [Alkalibacillus filiformis]|uniref:Glycosidase n=1 Tax=Alkalibacillus filiformis TaxID=200990 RepID=A0ABU0DTY0_9BACI|nr:alpha-amylase family glycosyl hydrolase [Alkalibacillus filiformis]MDQ0351746.1 glycosidase [Alkalibacillus filiformis]
MRRLTVLLVSLVALMLVFPIIGQAEQSDERNNYYYILIDRFQNSNSITEEGVDRNDPFGFHGGDFVGIADRISHIDDLGVSHVVLSPIFASDDYTGQTVLDYEQIQQTFGSVEDAIELVESFNEAGIEVILHFPIEQVSENSPIVEEEWVTEEGTVQLEDEPAQAYLLEQMTEWQETLGTSGFFISNADQLPVSYVDTLTNELSNQFWISELADFNESNVESILDAGFDRVLHGEFREDARELFKTIEVDYDPILNDPYLDDERVVHYMDHYTTDRFTRAMEESGFHPITRWKMALTYLYMTPNEPWLFQGTEVPSDGLVEDNSHHAMVNFLSGDEQLIRHIEKLESFNDHFPEVSHGDINVLHDDDYFLVFEREHEGNRVLVAINNSPNFQYADIDHLPSDMEMRGLIEDDLIRENEDGTYTVSLERESSNVYNVQPNQGIYWPLTSLFFGVLGAFIVFAIIMYRKNRRQDRMDEQEQNSNE